MIPRLAALALVSLLSAAPALAEKAATGATVPKTGGIGAGGGPAATAPVPTKAATMKARNEAEMLKAQKASAARDKAWDARTRNSMTSICKGC